MQTIAKIHRPTRATRLDPKRSADSRRQTAARRDARRVAAILKGRD